MVAALVIILYVIMTILIVLIFSSPSEFTTNAYLGMMFGSIFFEHLMLGILSLICKKSGRDSKLTEILSLHGYALDMSNVLTEQFVSNIIKKEKASNEERL